MGEVDAVALEVFRHRLEAIPEQMGAALWRTAHSTNIKERRDFSCALFGADGALVAQAAHIPVHLGSMPLALEALRDVAQLGPGDVALTNDPFCGGTHLPDITMVTPVFVEGVLFGYAVSRAHHADVGGASSGSIAPTRSIFEEGLRIPPVLWWRGGQEDRAVRDLILANVRTPAERLADLMAQKAAHHVAEQRVADLIRQIGADAYARLSDRLIAHSEAIMRAAIERIPDGSYAAEDFLDDDGAGTEDIAIRVTVAVSGTEAVIDFAGSSKQVPGCVNCPLAVTHAAVVYVFACLAGDRLTHNAGMLRPLHIRAPRGTVVCAELPAAVVGGNVETSQRIVDVLLQALAAALPGEVCAPGAGTMSSLSLGGIDPQSGEPFAYYETIGGGMGAAAGHHGESAIHTHMTNTRNTPVEALEMAIPLRVRRYAVAENTGGAGRWRGGEGIVRAIEVGVPTEVALLADRHRRGNPGLFGGCAGTPGSAAILRQGRNRETMPPKCRVWLEAGDVIEVHTPGGGGYGTPA